MTRKLLLSFTLLNASLLVCPLARADQVLKLMHILRTAGDYKQRMTAALALARRKDLRAVPALIAALKDPHDTVRSVVAGVLGKLGDTRAIPALKALLGTAKTSFLRSQAKEALVALSRIEATGKRAVSPLPRPPGSATPGSRVPGSAVPGSNGPSGGPGRIQASGTLGSLDPQAAQDGVNARLPAATACFNTAFQRHQYLAGAVQLLFRVDTRGLVKWLLLSRSDMGAYGAERCIVAAMKKARFDAPDGGEAEFKMPLTFGGGDPVVVLDAETSKEVRRFHKRCRSLLRGGLQAPPGLLVTVYLDSAGRVTSSGMSAGGVDISRRFASGFMANLRKHSWGRKTGPHRKLTYSFRCGARPMARTR